MSKSIFKIPPIPPLKKGGGWYSPFKKGGHDLPPFLKGDRGGFFFICYSDFDVSMGGILPYLIRTLIFLI